MKRSDRCLLLRIETGGLSLQEEDALVADLLRLAEKHGVAHVEQPLPLDEA